MRPGTRQLLCAVAITTLGPHLSAQSPQEMDSGAATSACAAVHDGAGSRSPLLLQNFGHANLHYGNVVTYIRMVGLLPPSS